MSMFCKVILKFRFLTQLWNLYFNTQMNFKYTKIKKLLSKQVKRNWIYHVQVREQL